MSSAAPRPVALITGAGQSIDIGAAIATRLARTAGTSTHRMGAPRRPDAKGHDLDAPGIVLAAVSELADLRIAAKRGEPGSGGQGWMTPEQLRSAATVSPRGRVGVPSDTAALVSFLCSADRGWINGQLLCSDSGLHA